MKKKNVYGKGRDKNLFQEKETEKGSFIMKEVIVIFATVILGIAIAGFVIGLEGTAKQMTDKIGTDVTNMIESH